MAEDVRILGNLPGVTVEILHRSLPERGAEQVTVTVTTVPNPAGSQPFLACPDNPWAAWAALSQAWVLPWMEWMGTSNPWAGLLPGVARRS